MEQGQASKTAMRVAMRRAAHQMIDRPLVLDDASAVKIVAPLLALGGHNYEILEDDTHVLEYKTGPYFGIEFDKKFI